MLSSCVYTCKALRFGTVGGRRLISRDDSCKMNQHARYTHSDTTSCRTTTDRQYMPTYTHVLPHTHTHAQNPENHEHTRVSNSYKEENGVRASEDELPCSLSIKLPSLSLSLSFVLFSKSFFSHRFKQIYLTAKVLRLTFFRFPQPFVPSVPRILLFISSRGYTLVIAFSLLQPLKGHLEPAAIKQV